MSASGEETMIPRRTAGDVVPMSFAQELLWLVDRANPGLTAYNVPRAIRIRGRLDTESLRRAFEQVVERHEILRTTYHAGEGTPVQRVRPLQPFVLPVMDLRALPEAQRAADVTRIVLEEARTPFDLAADPMLRARLLRVADDDHTLFIGSHHIVSDGWSKGILFRELSAAYEAYAAGRAPALAPLPVQYADFSIWQRDAMQGPALEAHLVFWRERLAGPLPPLELPTDFARAPEQRFDGARESVLLPSSLVQALRTLGMEHGATLYMVLLAAYQTVLHRYSGQDDIVTGSPIAGRGHAETEGLIGYFANILAMRTSFAGDPTFGELLARVAEHAVDAYEHDDVPFEKLVLDLREGQETPGHAPLFRCVLTMEDTLSDELRLGNAAVEPYTIDYGQAKFDLTLLVAEQPQGLRLGLWYRTDLFTAGYARRFLGHIGSVLAAAVANAETRISALPMLTAAEHAQLDAWNATAANEGAPVTVTALFEAQVARVPTRLAVVAPSSDGAALGSGTGTVAVTYAELNAQANRLARHLRVLGVTTDQPVGLLLDRSADAIVALLGILKAGGAYMPLSVDAPAARLAVQISESGASVVVTAGALADGVPASVTVVSLDRDATKLGALADGNLEPVATRESLAYVLYTSGSTGVPKGVAVTHANVLHYTRAVSRVLADVGPADIGDGFAALDGWRFGLASTLSADLGNTSVYPALLSGGTLHVLGKTVTTEPALYAGYVGLHPLDALKITPNHLVALTAGKRGDELAALLPSRWLVTGGEPLRLDVARQWLGARKPRVLNHYGPTETTVGVCTFEVTADSLDAVIAAGAQTVPIGRPLVNTSASVVDARRSEQPIAIPGELLIGGAGVARGYLHRPDLSVEQFVDFRGERVYRTGDRVRRLADGAIEFLGRADHQVKVRGFRVELGEIEHALRAHPGVDDGVVIVRDNAAGEPQLAAYAVPRQAGYAVSHGDRPSPDKLVAWLAAQVPEYMIPRSITLIDRIPLTANGKVDRAALPVPDSAEGAQGSVTVAPRTPTEAAVARIWADVLKRDSVGVTDSFLDLGGHSLLAIRVLGRISKEFGVRLALRALFETPTVEQIAQVIDAARRKRDEEAAMRDALAAVENLSDAEVSQSLAGDDPPRHTP